MDVRPILFLTGCFASAFVAGCGGAGSPGVPPAAGAAYQSSPLAIGRPAPQADSRTKSAVLKAGGGWIAIPSFGGFSGKLPYASSDAASGTKLTVTNSGTSNPLGAPTPPKMSPLLFVSAAVSGKSKVTFKSTTAKASLTSKAITSDDTYTLYLYASKKQVKKIELGVAKKTLQFATPLSAIAIAPSAPLVIELVATVIPKPVASPSSLSFSSATPETFTVQEPGYTGKLTAASSDSTVATVKPASAKGPTATFTVTPVGGGKCTIAVTDSASNSAMVKVSVTAEIIKVNGKHGTALAHGGSTR